MSYEYEDPTPKCCICGMLEMGTRHIHPDVSVKEYFYCKHCNEKSVGKRCNNSECFF